MTSLTQTAIMTRKIIRYGIFSIIALIVLRIVFLMGIKLYRQIFPAPPPPATVAFDRLPKINFKPKEVAGNFTFTLETAEGGLPKLPPQAKVYFMPKPAANLLSLDSAKIKAQSLGFKADGQELSATTYRFGHPIAPVNLEMNIVLGSFSLSYDLKYDPTPLEARPPSPEIAASYVRSFLSLADLLVEDLTGPTTHQFLKLSESQFIPALSLSEANLIKINLFRRDYDNLPVLTASPSSANVWFLVSGATSREKQIVAGQYHYFLVDEAQMATYPIKTAEQAWNQLGSQLLYIADPGSNQAGDNVIIRKISLAYFDPDEPADFLQPIIVFEGDKGFIAYLPAVTADYYPE